MRSFVSLEKEQILYGKRSPYGCMANKTQISLTDTQMGMRTAIKSGEARGRRMHRILLPTPATDIHNERDR